MASLPLLCLSLLPLCWLWILRWQTHLYHAVNCSLELRIPSMSPDAPRHGQESQNIPAVTMKYEAQDYSWKLKPKKMP